MLVLSHVVSHFWLEYRLLSQERNGVIHVACMRGLNSLLVEEEVFNAIVTMVYAVFVMGEVDRSFLSVWEEMKFLKGF